MRYFIALCTIVLFSHVSLGEEVVWSLFGDEPEPIATRSPQLTDDFETVGQFFEAGNPQRIVVFTADWCPPCQRFKPILDQFDSGESFDAEIQIINIDRHRALYRLLAGKEAIPQLVWREQGKTVRTYGEQSKSYLKQLLDRQAEQRRLTSQSSSEVPQPGITSHVRVVEVYDGDTVTVEFTQLARVRLLDCWAPEVRSRDPTEKAQGLAAKQFLQSRIEGKAGIIHIPTNQANRVGDVTSMGRILGKLYVDGQDISELMISSGHATKNKEG